MWWPEPSMMRTFTKLFSPSCLIVSGGLVCSSQDLEPYSTVTGTFEMSIPSAMTLENFITMSCRNRLTSDGPYGPANRIGHSGFSIFDTAKIGRSQNRMRALFSNSFGFSGMPHGSASMRWRRRSG
uniref:Secreted protein n=1 Tax=Anopheles merus TaxID=30066 RepID=A0A182VJS4_ANOME